ncbi:amino acid permease [Coniophora puteana RWD-64-598 SS2]|uniref:Amino acid permease n=1 Tax=Coniophora puteana (strain RWD-64-598) TaxID=741705 RepID=R7SHD2_CONPW|nr:amino acid permease [Coniophora puteana RWD-64-598 SS2]EIW74479.1 amino acid permease [Coniophora puteana RWD-64-598 SS2]
MISVGGVIGTGLFLGSATALKNAGPVGMLLAYIFIGSICFCVMVSVGEMISFLPIAGGHIRLAERFVDPAFSFALGWSFWYGWVVSPYQTAELSAAATLIDFWHPGVSNAVWITMCLVIAISINMLGVGVYGESEFIFCSIKVITIVGLIILGIVLDLGGGPNHERLGFKYWRNPGPFVQYEGIEGNLGRVIGWSAAVTQAAFSYVGTEVVAIAAAEAKNPRRNLPRAVRRVYARILVFYIGSVFVIGLLVPSTEPLLDLDSGNASASPFVIAINRAGIKGLPSVINVAFLTSAWSAASGDLYIASRGLYGLAAAGNAPKIFLRTTRSGFPIASVIFSAAFSLLSYMATSASSGEVFTWFSSMTATCGLWGWCAIGIIYVRYYAGIRAQKIDRRSLPYSSRLQPFASWWAIFACGITMLFSGYEVFLRGQWSTATFVTNYLPIILFPVLYVLAKIVTRIPLVPVHEMDFVSGSRVDDELQEPRSQTWLISFWTWLM